MLVTCLAQGFLNQPFSYVDFKPFYEEEKKMTFNKTATAIIVASVFCGGMANANDNLGMSGHQRELLVNQWLTNGTPVELADNSNKYGFHSSFTGQVVSLTLNSKTRNEWLDFGYKLPGAPDAAVTWNFDVTNSTLNLNKGGLKLRHNLSVSGPAENHTYNLQFQQGSTLNGDIINSYDGATTVQGNPVTHQISASGNNTTVTFNSSTWNGSLYSKLESTLNPNLDIPVAKHDTHNKVILDQNSTWTGSITNEALGTNTVEINDQDSTWTVNDYSMVNELTSQGKVIVDAAILDFQEGNSSVDHIELKHPDSHIQVSEGANVTLKDVKVSNATAQGHIDFRSLDNNSLKVDAADKPLNIVVDKDVNDKYGLDKTLEKLDTQLTTGKDVTGNFTVEQSVIGDGATGTLANDKLTVTGTTKNTNLVVTSELVAIQMMQWRAEADDMNQRMGELRDSTDANGLWVRTYGGKSEATKVDNEFIGFQFGYDHNVASGANQQFVGGAISYTKGDANFSTGTGDNDTFAFTGYSTWLLDSGSYVDFSAKYGKLNSDFDIKTGLGKLNGDYSTHALAMGVEVGHRFPVANLFYVEPQMAFTASHIFAEDFGAGQGVTIEQDSINSYVARAGLAAGIKCPDNKGSVWMKASYLYDFDGETTTTAKKGAMTNQFDQDFGGGWYELGLGASVNFTKNLHGYADFEYASGAEIETPYKWNVGVRYTY